MNAELKVKWIEALRSGKYLQGQRCLRKGEKYCCLGVLCDLYDNTQWRDRDEAGHYGYGEVYNTGLLSPYVRELAQVSATQEDQLMQLNDESGYTFLQIADYISAYL